MAPPLEGRVATVSSSDETPRPDLDRLLHPRPIDASGAEPIFVLGSVRSGTSIVVRALHDGAAIPGFSEGNVLSLLQRMLDEVERQFGGLSPDYLADQDEHLIANVDRSALEAHLINYFKAVYLQHCGEGRWVDKSPESYTTAPMVRCCPLIRRIFPKARFIFCIRRPIENILSKQRKFPGPSFKHYCRSWTDTVHYWGKFRELNPGCFLELRQEDLALEAKRCAEKIADFLELSPEHRDRMAAIFAGPRAEQTQAAQEHRFIGIDETPWTWEQKAEFIELVGPFLPATGYGLEAKLLRAGPIKLFYPTAPGAIELEGIEAKDFRPIEPQGSLQITPRARRGPARVRYTNLSLNGQTSFHAQIHAAGSRGTALSFGLRIETADRSQVLADAKIDLTPGETREWDVPFDAPLQGPHDIIIANELEGAEADSNTQAQWLNPELRSLGIRGPS